MCSTFQWDLQKQKTATGGLQFIVESISYHYSQVNSCPAWWHLTGLQIWIKLHLSKVDWALQTCKAMIPRCGEPINVWISFLYSGILSMSTIFLESPGVAKCRLLGNSVSLTIAKACFGFFLIRMNLIKLYWTFRLGTAFNYSTNFIDRNRFFKMSSMISIKPLLFTSVAIARFWTVHLHRSWKQFGLCHAKRK